MTRTLFVGEPAPRDLDVYELVARAQAAAIEAIEAAVSHGEPDGPLRAGERSTPSPATSSPRPATATTSATALGTASASPRTSCRRSGGTPRTMPLPSPTVFSVEPGVYLDGETGVRIEDLVLFDAGRAGSSA